MELPNPLKLPALSLLLLAACGNELEPRGQLMIAINSDMSVTKDMDEVRVEVKRADGTSLPDRQIPILPSQPAPFGKPLPGTLAIVPSDAGGESVRVRLTARRLNQDTGLSESRVVREAIVKVPTDRIAMLSMPLRWLCDGQVEAAEGDSFRSACPDEDDTCVAGACKSAKIEQNLLPDYQPSSVFGGGTPSGEGSKCLDVPYCFAQANVVRPAEDCSIPLPAAADPSKLNVALALPPESDGHCLDDPKKGAGKGSCYVPLDSDPEEGFWIDGSRIRLPEAACLRTNLVGIATTLACDTKSLSIPVCGPWNGWTAQGSDGAGGTSGVGAPGGASASGASPGQMSEDGGTSASGGTSSNGGFSTGGAPGKGGAAAIPGGGTGGKGGAGTAATGGSSNAAPVSSYWSFNEWHGCTWIFKSPDGKNSVSPQDFVNKPETPPYCISGTVGAEPSYLSYVELGFNVNQQMSCIYEPTIDAMGIGPAGITPGKNGIAINFTKSGNFPLRLQIQGPNGFLSGEAGDSERWCANIDAAQGKAFLPWTSFTPRCWESTPDKMGTPYALQELSTVVFVVPGALTDTPYDFCVVGLASGNSADDAPGLVTPIDQTGTLGGPGSTQLDFARVKVNVDGHDYIIQNNNFANPSNTDLTLSYKDNSFKITSGSGNSSETPASYPSIYIGNNGNTSNGAYSTKPGDNLPSPISAITSITSTFRYSGSTTVFSAAYDIWLASSPPAASYNASLNGSVMILLRDPQGKQPIGSKVASGITIAGMAWDVWVGTQSNGPVIAFVNPLKNDDSRAQNFANVNLKDFLTAAGSFGIASTMYVTDVFGGFQIWNGGAGGNLSVDEFACIVAKG